jgi:hypothetical protein
MYFTVMTFSSATLSVTKFGIKTVDLCCTLLQSNVLQIKDIQLCDSQYNDVQHNDGRGVFLGAKCRYST